eukprot:5757515-Amphidinium_carterae.1
MIGSECSFASFPVPVLLCCSVLLEHAGQRDRRLGLDGFIDWADHLNQQSEGKTNSSDSQSSTTQTHPAYTPNSRDLRTLTLSFGPRKSTQTLKDSGSSSQSNAPAANTSD